MTKIMWKDIKGYEGLYKVTSLGDIYSITKKRFIYQSIDRYGYKQCLLYNKEQDLKRRSML